MSWEQQKNILYATIAIVVVMLAFLLGAAFGTTIDAKQFIDTLNPVLSTIGSWLSGIGTIGAVFVALWQTDQQAKKDRANLKLTFTATMTSIHSGILLCIQATSIGQRPATINSISITGGEGCTHCMILTDFERGSSPLPAKLEYGEKASYFLPSGFEQEIADFIQQYCHGSANHIKLNIGTTTDNFLLHPDRDMINLFESCTKKPNDRL